MLARVAFWYARLWNSRAPLKLELLQLRKNRRPIDRSEVLEERLSTGAVLEEVALQGDRLHFRLEHRMNILTYFAYFCLKDIRYAYK